MGVLQGSKKQLQRLMEVYTNIGAKYTKIGRGGVLNENVYISYLDDVKTNILGCFSAENLRHQMYRIQACIKFKKKKKNSYIISEESLLSM